MLAFDILLAAIVGWGFFNGFRKGFIVSVLSLLAIVAGIMLAIRFVAVAAAYLQEWLNTDSPYLPFAAFLLVFLLVFIGVKLLARLLDKLLELGQLGLINRLAGGLFGAILVAFFLSALLWLFFEAGIITSELRMQSHAYKYLEPVAPFILQYSEKAIPGLSGLLEDAGNVFNHFAPEISPPSRE